MKFDTNSDMEQEEEALYYYSSNKNEIFQTQDDTLFIKPESFCFHAYWKSSWKS